MMDKEIAEIPAGRQLHSVRMYHKQIHLLFT